MIVDIVSNVTIKDNLIKAAVMTLLYPFTKYDQQFSKYEPSSRNEVLSLNPNNNLEGRISTIEARQTLLEADLVLLRGQLDYIPSKASPC